MPFKIGQEVRIVAGPFKDWRAAVLEDRGKELLVFNGNSQFLVAPKDVRKVPKG
jgi:transcription antitermination factor NusG